MLFDALFGQEVEPGFQVEIRGRRRDPDEAPRRRWANSAAHAEAIAAELDAQGYDAYFGVALRQVKHRENGKRDGTRNAFASSSACWVDLDNPNKLSRYILRPSFVVNSGKNLHLYWMLESPCELIQAVEQANTSLADFAGVDHSCVDAVHVLRVPGTHNYKYGQPLPVEYVYQQPELRYSIEDLSALHKVPDKIVAKIVDENFEGDRSRRDWAVVRALVDAGLSDTAIWAIFQEWPVGDKYHELGEQYLQHTVSQARERGDAEQNFTLRVKGFDQAEAPKPKTKKRSKKHDPEADEPAGPNLPDGLVAYPSLRLAEGAEGTYSVNRKGDSVELIASFRLHVQGMVQADDSLEGAGQEPDEYVLAVEANGKTWHNVVLPVSAFDDDRKLRKHLQRAAWAYWGTTSQANAMRQMLILKWNAAGKPRKVVVRQLGRQVIKSGGKEYDVFATSSGVFDAKTGTPYDNLVYARPSVNVPTVNFDFSPVSDWVQIRAAAESLVQVHTRDVTLPLLAWWVACTYKEPLMSNDVHFPHFLLHGTRGSGKSTLLRMFQQLQGIEPTSGDQLSSGTTPFVLSRTLGASTSVPIRLSEFRSDTLRDVHRFNQIMRQVYDGGVDARGRADQSTVTYVYTAPVCLDGEEPFVDAALKERTIMAYLSTDVLENNPDYQRIRRLMPSLPLAKLGGELLKHAAQQDPIELYMQATELVQQAFTNLPLRVENNAAVLVMGLLTYATFCRQHWGKCLITPEDPLEIHRHLLPCISQLVDIETGFSRLVADDFVEAVLNHIAMIISQNEQARSDIHFRFEPQDGGTVGIHLASAYSWWSKEAQRTHRGQPVERNTVRRMLQNERMLTDQSRIGKYVVNIVQAACTNTKVVQRLYMIDAQRAAAAGLDVPNTFVPPAEAYFEMKEGKVSIGFGS